MSIKVSCACGKTFQAKPKLAGKTVKCPACSQPLAIPNPSIAPDGDPLGLGDLGGDEVAAPSANGDPLALGATELEVEGAAAAQNICVACRSPLPADAILCVQCGVNQRTRQQLQKNTSTKMKVGWKSVESRQVDGHGELIVTSLFGLRRRNIDLSEYDAVVVDYGEDEYRHNDIGEDGHSSWTRRMLLGLLSGLSLRDAMTYASTGERYTVRLMKFSRRATYKFNFGPNREAMSEFADLVRSVSDLALERGPLPDFWGE